MASGIFYIGKGFSIVHITVLYFALIYSAPAAMHRTLSDNKRLLVLKQLNQHDKRTKSGAWENFLPCFL